MPIPSQGIKFDENEIKIPCLKLTLQNKIPREFQKINQIELDSIYAYVAVTIKEVGQIKPSSWIGVDLNATGHCLVASNPSSGKVLKLGKSAQHIHLKYKNTRKNLQKRLKYNAVKKIKDRESVKVKDLNHKISSTLIREAKKQNAGIVLEDLGGIRKIKKVARSFKYSLHSWSFYQLRKFIEYKAMLNGIPIVNIDPAYTSKQRSRCGLLGNRTGKKFKCPHCGHVEHADVNASFVIAERHQGIVRLPAERDASKGSTDAPQEAMA